MRIQSSSALIDYDGKVVLKDRKRNLPAYTRYLQSIVTDRHSFIKEELLELIGKLMYTTRPRLFRQTIEWISDNYRQSGEKCIGELLDETLLYSFDYLAEERAMVRSHVDLPTLLARLRGVYTSSRSIDPALFSLREKTEWCVRQATENRNDSVIASVRTAVLLHLVIRTMTMRHYTGCEEAVSWVGREEKSPCGNWPEGWLPAGVMPLCCYATNTSGISGSPALSLFPASRRLRRADAIDGDVPGCFLALFHTSRYFFFTKSPAGTKCHCPVSGSNSATSSHRAGSFTVTSMERSARSAAWAIQRHHLAIKRHGRLGTCLQGIFFPPSIVRSKYGLWSKCLSSASESGISRNLSKTSVLPSCNRIDINFID